ncbi:MAG: hypothetical protein MR673_04110 [Fusobacterium perfoetens]|uniref:hypothetical protein n=1 Tax=Fusobacterium perfoetens TaxID=852 RepID=UPI0023F29639|nr:hypothetical protein [Fusobacterium perfoetens]MCI6152296.1 hypothetical protein [Fusobacterium perfoetens]MDY3238154.1 hypothetical protein [Fusobacterium perfoetens]
MLKIVGIILIIVGTFNLFQYKKATERNFYVNGTLIDYSYSPSVNRYFPVFRYIVDGVIYEEEYRGVYKSEEKIEKLKNINIDEMPKATKKFMKKLKDVNYIEYEIGKEYKLLVNKNNPKEYWIAEDGTNKGREYIWIGIGIMFLMVSFILKLIKLKF